MVEEISLEPISGVYLLVGKPLFIPQILNKPCGPLSNKAYYIGQSSCINYRSHFHSTSSSGHKLISLRMFLLKRVRKSKYSLDLAEKRFICAARELGLQLTNIVIPKNTFLDLEPEKRLIREALTL